MKATLACALMVGATALAGASAPAEHLFERFGFTADAIVPQIVAALEKKGD